MSSCKMADLFGLGNRGTSDRNAYDVSIAVGERKRDIFATTRKDAIHQAWKERWLDPELGGADWDEIAIKRRK